MLYKNDHWENILLKQFYCLKASSIYMPRFSLHTMKSLYTCTCDEYLINIDFESLCIQVVRSCITLKTRKSTQFNFGNIGKQKSC